MANKVDCIRLKEPNDGGWITKQVIDSIDEFQSDTLEVSRLNQDGFEYLLTRFGSRFRKISFNKCPRIEDLSPLESFGQLEAIDYYWNQKAQRLWNLTKTPRLRALTLNNFSGLRDLSDLAVAPALASLTFGNLFSGSSSIESLEPVGSIATLQTLCFNPKKIADKRAAPLIRLKNLKSVDFSNRLFSTEQIAWLMARLPGVESERFCAYEHSGLLAATEVMVTGKGKPVLHIERDAVRLEKYVRSFERLVEHYRAHPLEAEPVL